MLHEVQNDVRADEARAAGHSYGPVGRGDGGHYLDLLLWTKPLLPVQNAVLRKCDRRRRREALSPLSLLLRKEWPDGCGCEADANVAEGAAERGGEVSAASRCGCRNGLRFTRRRTVFCFQLCEVASALKLSQNYLSSCHRVGFLGYFAPVGAPVGATLL